MLGLLLLHPAGWSYEEETGSAARAREVEIR